MNFSMFCVLILRRNFLEIENFKQFLAICQLCKSSQ
jgi:hypothetical protein